MQEISLLTYKKPVTSIKKIKYTVKIRFIMYTMIETCIDIIFTISIISYFLKIPKPDHFSVINQISRYLASS